MRRGTNTVVAREIAGADAKSEYAAKTKSVKKLLERLGKAVDKDAAEFKKDSGNWGYVGSMAHVESGLLDLIEFMGD